MRPPLVVWQFTDGKPGHESQTRGLISALKRRDDVHAYPIPVATCRCGVGSLLWRRHPCKYDFPPPDFILACGRSTHFAALAARRACGGRLISLMKPPLPLRLYDLCLIPEHDGVAATANVLLTHGVLNPVSAMPMTADRHHRGLFLIGGPSAHHGWNGAKLVDQIIRVLKKDCQRAWMLTTSRRTPAEFVRQLAERLNFQGEEGCPEARHPNDALRLTVMPVEQTPPGWVADQLSRSDVAAVTEDSVSMVYESLTAGVAVSLIAAPRRGRGRNRVSAGVERLLQAGMVNDIGQFLETGAFCTAPHALAEADRCADVVLSRWSARLARAA